MPEGSKRQPKQPHIWRHPNGIYYAKFKDGRRSLGTKDLAQAADRIKKYIDTLPTSKPARLEAVPKDRPSLWRHRNGIYYILYRNTTGLRTRKTTGTKDPAEAEAIYHRYLAALVKPRHPGMVTIGAILQGYLEDHGKHVASPESLRHSVNALLADMQHLRPTDLSDARIRLFANARKNQGRKPATIAKDLQILRAGLRWGLRQSPPWLEYEPIFRMPVKISPPKDRWLTREEAARLIDSCQAHHLRIFIQLALHTTKRTGAILALKWSDIKNGYISFGEGTGNKRRGDVPINATLAEVLMEAWPLATTDWVVEYGGGRVLSIKTGFKAACRRAGLVAVTPHTLRHTAATWMAMAGVPMSEIARVLGNSESVCEKVYAKYHPSYLRRAVDAISAA